MLGRDFDGRDLRLAVATHRSISESGCPARAVGARWTAS